MACWCNGQCPNIGPVRELVGKNRIQQAEAAAKLRLADAPSCIELHRVIAQMLTDTNRGSFAAPHIRQLLDAGTPDALILAGHNARSIGRMPAATGYFSAAIEQHPDKVRAWEGFAGVFEAMGLFDQARDVLADARKRFPQAVELRRVDASVHAGAGDYERALQVLAGDSLMPVELMDRGRYKEAIGDYAGAWSDWMAGKAALVARGHAYSRDLVRDQVEGLYEISMPARFSLLWPHHATPRPGEPSPIFITGYPRSGTTLLETVLSMHRDIVAGDELMFIGELTQRIPAALRIGANYPLALMALAEGDNAGAAYGLRDYYLRRALQKIDAPARKWFTDKMPINEIHAPLMRLLFPESKILYLRRHPLDIMLSNMSHVITHGYWYAATLETCAENYVLIDGLLQHYRRHLPGAIREIRYEAFVSDQVAQTDALIEHLKLEHDPACYRPQENARVARTISYRQVKAPVHDRSVGRWRPFAEQLAPVVEILRPIIEREGYEL